MKNRFEMISKIVKKIKQRKLIIRNMRDINSLIRIEVKIEQLQYMALNSDRPLTTDECQLGSLVIVSLTTFSKKIHEVHLAIESIAQQSIRPNKIILWLDEDEFSIETIPSILIKQINRGLEVRFFTNIKSYKKIVPTLIFFPNSYIITIDDDVLYANNMIDILVKEQKRFPKMIIGHRGHKITFDGANLPKPYRQWDYDINDDAGSHNIMLTGCGGIIYPPKSLHLDTTKIDIFQKLSPNADDLWLKIMAIKNNTRCKITEHSDGGLALKSYRNIGLAQMNVKNGGNDQQLKKLIEYYKINF
jgi:hypothetical protein